MPSKFALSVLVAAAASVAVVLRMSSQPVAATGAVVLMDSDDDFLPDVVEWAVLTNPLVGDTDGDDISDFVEVVEFGDPRTAGTPLPPDDQMRVIVSGPQVGSPDRRVWLHVFYRIMSSGSGASPLSAIQALETWLELPWFYGLRVPLNAIGLQDLVLRERATTQGYWVEVSIPLVAPEFLAMVLPCTITVESTIAGTQRTSGVELFGVEGDIATLVPYANDRFVLQSLLQYSEPGAGSGSNRVCVLDLVEQYTTPAGTTYLVQNAACEDANDLECGAGCLASNGMTITIPGGVSILTH